MERQKENRGPNIPEEWKLYITRLALRESHIPRQLLADNILKDMKRSTDYTANKPLPERASIAKLISTARNRPDKTWSLGIVEELEHGYALSPDAVKDLLAVWKHSLAIGREFTIREAKWATRIRGAIQREHRRIGTLFAFAYEYAIREKVSEILKKPMDTHDLDGGLSTTDGHYDSEHVVFRALNTIPRMTLNFAERDRLLPERDRSTEYLDAEVASLVADRNQPLSLRRDGRFVNEIRYYSAGLSDIEDRAAAALLVYLSKGPSWGTLSMEEYMAILDYVKEVVTKELSDIEFLIDYENLDFSHYADRPSGLTPEDVLCPELLRRVGYEVTEHAETIDNPYPHSKDYRNKVRQRAVWRPISITERLSG